MPPSSAGEVPHEGVENDCPLTPSHPALSPTSLSLSPEQERRIDEILARYPTRRAACIPTLHVCQEAVGWVSPDVIAFVAQRLGMATSEVQGVVTFYTMYHQAPVGKHVLWVCRTLSCDLQCGPGWVDADDHSVRADDVGGRPRRAARSAPHVQDAFARRQRRPREQTAIQVSATVSEQLFDRVLGPTARESWTLSRARRLRRALGRPSP